MAETQPHEDEREKQSGREDELPRATDRRMLSWFFHYLRPHMPTIVVAALAMLLNSFADLAGPTLLGKGVIDRVILQQQVDRLPYYAGLLLAAYAGSAILSGVRNNLMHRLGQRFVHEVRVEASEHLQRMSLDFFDRHRTGDIMSRLTSDVNTVEEMIVHGTDTVLTDGLRTLGTVAVLMYLDARLALYALIPLPIFMAGVIWFAFYMRPLYRRVRDELGDINADLQENISGVRVIRAFSREEHESGKIEARSRKYLDTNVHVIWMWSTFYPALSFIVSCSILLLVWLGAPRAAEGGIAAGAVTTGDIVVFVTLLQQFYTRLAGLMKVYNTYNKALAAMGRIFLFFDVEPSVQDAADAEPIGEIQGRVELKDICFRYRDGEMVLRDIDITAEPGETVALVGRSGAGKTSLVNLIPRFHDPLEGQVLVDGRDIRTVTQQSLRRQIAIVPQDTFLFSGSVRDNIRYGRLDAGDGEIVEAAKAAYAHDFIMNLPEGYDSEVGERGVRLSGGQAQRIAIARALLADPKILILDEATSLVDTEAEQHIQAALENLMEGRTTFIIAHRLSTVRDADTIIVIDDGEIAEKADHSSLMEEGGLYAEMWSRQFAEGSKWLSDTEMTHDDFE